jgi:hypothetical protein
MYLESYLRLTANPKTRWTVGTFLAYELTGAARNQWSGGYQRALINSLSRLVESGEVKIVDSMKGGTAYIRSSI